jgi:GntR family transcriptional regulator
MEDNLRIDRGSPIPLYYQLEQQLLERIKKRELRIGSRLPSEEELIAQSGLSRFTVRQALQELEKEGWVSRIRGKGTFVSEGKVPLSVAWQLLGFTEDMRRKGHRVESRIIENRLARATLESAAALKIKPHSNVVFVKRLRFLDGEPYLVDFVWVRSDLCPGMEAIDLTDQSLSRTLETRFGIRVHHARRTLSIARAKAPLARLLGVRPATPLFLLTDLGFTKDEAPIQFAKTYINEKKSEFVFDLYRQEQIDIKEKVKIDHSANPKLRR